MKNKFDAKLLFTDTDSLVYEIKGEDVYEDEFKGKIISESAGLKSKMYLLICVDDEEVSKAKGVNKKNET